MVGIQIGDCDCHGEDVPCTADSYNLDACGTGDTFRRCVATCYEATFTGFSGSPCEYFNRTFVLTRIAECGWVGHPFSPFVPDSSFILTMGGTVSGMALIIPNSPSTEATYLCLWSDFDPDGVSVFTLQSTIGTCPWPDTVEVQPNTTATDGAGRLRCVPCMSCEAVAAEYSVDVALPPAVVYTGSPCLGDVFDGTHSLSITAALYDQSARCAWGKEWTPGTVPNRPNTAAAIRLDVTQDPTDPVKRLWEAKFLWCGDTNCTYPPLIHFEVVYQFSESKSELCLADKTLTRVGVPTLLGCQPPFVSANTWPTTLAFTVV